MKKVLVLMLVLGVASLANAGLMYQIGANYYAGGSVITLTGATTLTVGIYNDTLLSGVPGITNGFVLTGGDTTLNGDYTITPGNLPAGTWSVVQYDPTYSMMVYENPAVSTTKVGELFTFGTAVGALGGTFVMTDDSMNPLDAGLTFVTPEPATMLILGLGGLLLRRK